MKSTKRRTQLSEKKQRKESRYAQDGKGNSKYALKHAEQKKGIFRETSPFRFGKEI